jgi:hypothetical protein
VLRARLGDLDPVRELPYRPAAVFLPHPGRTDDSIRPRAATTPTFSLAWKGASTDGEPTIGGHASNDPSAPEAVVSVVAILGASATEAVGKRVHRGGGFGSNIRRNGLPALRGTQARTACSNRATPKIAIARFTL